MKYVLKIYLVILLSVMLSKCNPAPGNASEKAKSEIADAEKAFDRMASEKGIKEAFWYYADTNAVIKRGRDSLIHGKEGIRNFYSGNFYKTASVSWSPDFIDASESGNLGYTYGKYKWHSKDSAGIVTGATGVFHTVWKKQADGSWKYVWD